MKKYLVLGALLLALLAVPTVTKAATINELMVVVQQLQAQINTLISQRSSVVPAAVLPVTCVTADVNKDGVVNSGDTEAIRPSLGLNSNCVPGSAGFCPDVNGSGHVDNFDVLAIRGKFGCIVNASVVVPSTVITSAVSLYDVNGDGHVDNSDLIWYRANVIGKYDFTSDLSADTSDMQVINNHLMSVDKYDFDGNGSVDNSDLIWYRTQVVGRYDLTGDGRIDNSDLIEIRKYVGLTDLKYDFNGSGSVNSQDLLWFQANVMNKYDLTGDGGITTADLDAIQAYIQDGDRYDFNGSGRVDNSDLLWYRANIIGRYDFTSDQKCNADDLAVIQNNITSPVVDQKCLKADVNGDGVVNSFDVLAVRGQFGCNVGTSTSTSCIKADVNSSGAVDNLDILAVRGQIGCSVPVPSVGQVSKLDQMASVLQGLQNLLKSLGR